MSTASFPAAFSALVDDAAIFPPGDAPLGQAVSSYADRLDTWEAGLVGPLVCRDTDIGSVGEPVPLSVVVSTGAGGIDAACRLAARKGVRLAAIETALRDLDDLAGNARRVVAAVDAARAEGHLHEEVPVFVELPQGEVTYGWQAAADEVAAAELRLKLRTGGVEAHLFPTAGELAAWIDAALDRETPFKCTAGLHHAVRHRDDTTGFEHHGFLNVLLATRQAFDGAPLDEVVATLEQRDASAVAEAAAAADVASARRWFASFGSCSVDEPLEDLVALGLLEAPA